MKKIINQLPYSLKKLFPNAYPESYYEYELLPKIKNHPLIKPQKDTPQNILYLNTLVGRGGAAKITYDMVAKNIINRGYDAKLLVDEVFKNINDERVSKIEKKYSKESKLLSRYQYNNGWLDFFHDSNFEIKNNKWFQNSDILHLNNLHGNYFSLFALPELTALKPTVWTLHDEFAYTGRCAFTYGCNKWEAQCRDCPTFEEYPGTIVDTSEFLFNTKEKIYEASDFTVLCYSEWMKKRLEKSILKNKDIKFIYNGIDENIYKPYDKTLSREELGLPLDKKILLFSSNGKCNDKQKGGKYLLETYERMKHRDDILFIAIGNDKREYIAPNFLNIEYVFDETKMAKYYSAADLFIFPTLAETFGLVIAESMACKTPVITFNTGPTPELVEHMKNGYVAEHKNTKDFIEGIEMFLQNEDLRQNAQNSARQTVENKFTLSKMLNSYETLYKDIYEKRLKLS